MIDRDVSPDTIEVLRRVAKRCSAVPHEAEDLVQEVLLAAIEKQRDWNDPQFLPWAAGAVRNWATFAARTAARRRKREHSYAVHWPQPADVVPALPESFIAGLPRSRRVVARLVNLGMSRAEIAYLLQLSDAALRQRISGVRRAFAAFTGESESDPQIASPPDGRARRALKASLPMHARPIFGIRDPDGNPLFFTASGHVSDLGGNT